MKLERRREIGRRTTAARKRLKLTQQELADKAGVSLGTIGNLENGRALPQQTNRAAIATALGEDIFEENRAAVARAGWPDDVQVFADVLGQYLASLTPEERAARVSHWMAEIVRKG